MRRPVSIHGLLDRSGRALNNASPVRHAAPMAPEANANLVRPSLGVAQPQSEQPSHSGGARTDTVVQSAPDIKALLCEYVELNRVELDMASSFISTLKTYHQTLRLFEERETLCQQLAMLLHFGYAPAGSSVVVEPIEEKHVMAAYTSMGGRADTEILQTWVVSVSESFQHRVQLLRTAATPPVTPAAAALQLSQLVGAQRAALAVIRDRVGRTMLEHAPKYQEAGVSAETFIKSLLAQGPADMAVVKESVDGIRQTVHACQEGASASGFCLDPINTRSTESSDGSETVRHDSDSARSNRAAKKSKAAAAPAVSSVSARSAPVSGQLSKTAATGLCPAAGGDAVEGGEQPVKAEGRSQLQLTRAEVQGMLDIDRVDNAVASLDAMEKDAAQAASESAWMFKYLQTVRACLPSSGGDAGGEAEQLYNRVRAWQEAQEGLQDTLALKMRNNRAMLVAIREAWERSVRLYLDSVFSGEGKRLQVLPVEAVSLVERHAEGFGSMESCFELMQMQVARILQSANARRAAMAATTYTLLAATISREPPTEMRKSKSEPGTAAHVAAADSCASPTAQRPPAVEPGATGGSASSAAATSSQAQAQPAQGPPATKSTPTRTGGSGSSGGQPAEAKAGAGAALRAELVRWWAATMYAEEPLRNARSAAEARWADLAAAAKGRVREARMQTYPVPRRVSQRLLSAKAGACQRAEKLKGAADDRLVDSLAGVGDESASLAKSCESLVQAAHQAGLSWLLEHGATPREGQAWFSEFAQVCAGVHAAHVQAHCAVEPIGFAPHELDEARTDAPDATVAYVEYATHANQEKAIRLMQEFCRNDAAHSTYCAARMEAFREHKAEAEKALARLQQEKTKLQALEACTTAALAEAESGQQREADERAAAERAQRKKAKKARRRQAEAAAATAAPPLARESAVGSSAAAHPPHALAEAEAEAGELSSVAPQAAEQPNDAALAADVGRPEHAEQAAGQSASDTEEHSSSHMGQQEHVCTIPASAVAAEQLPSAISHPQDNLSLVLPGIPVTAGPQHPADTAATPDQAPSTAPANAAHTLDPATLWLDDASAARHAQEHGQSRVAAASPREQRERLRACLLQRAWSADRRGALDVPWPEPSVCELTATDSGLCEGGLAERLFRRMGSTPAAAALLRRLVCPITKDFANDAVVASDGCTYEREAIEGWVQHSSRSAHRNHRTRSTQLEKNRLYTTIMGMLLPM